jgi:transposase InsO family protein
VEPDVRDAIVGYVGMITTRTNLPLKRVLAWLGLKKNKYHLWRKRLGLPNRHNGQIPRSTWILPWEREAIIGYRMHHREEGYRYLTYLMLDEDVVAVSPSTTYRVLKGAGLLCRWNTGKPLKKKGFDQPLGVHEHWHVDIKYVNFHGSFLFLISVIDGFSRYIIHHELRLTMQENDVQITIERALQRYGGVHPRVISDNGTQFIAKDFTDFMRIKGLQHVRTSVNHPQSNGKLERWHRTLSQECLRTKSLLDLDDARRVIAEYVTFYNTKRLHSSIYFLTPEEVLNGHMQERLNIREDKLARAQELRRSARQAA